MDNEVEGLALGQSTDGWRGMKRQQEVAQMVVGRQGEREVAAQMDQIGSTHGAWALLSEVVSEVLQTLGNIGRHDALLLNVLRAPRDRLALALQLAALQFHRTGKGDGTPTLSLAFEQYLGRRRQPHATLGRIDQGNEHTRIETTGTQKQLLGLYRRGLHLVGTARQHNLAERALTELGMEVGEVDVVREAGLRTRRTRRTLRTLRTLTG